MLDLLTIRSKDYRRNYDRAGVGGTPCAICGKLILHGNEAGWLHIHDGGAAIVTEAEAAERGEAGDLSYFPIGRECRRKHPEVSEYLIGTNARA